LLGFIPEKWGIPFEEVELKPYTLVIRGCFNPREMGLLREIRDESKRDKRIVLAFDSY